MSLSIVLIRILRKYLKRRDFLLLISTNKSNRTLLDKIFLREYYIYYNPYFRNNVLYLPFIEKCFKIQTCIFPGPFKNARYLNFNTGNVSRLFGIDSIGIEFLKNPLDLSIYKKIKELTFYYDLGDFRDVYLDYPRSINLLVPEKLKLARINGAIIIDYPESLKEVYMDWEIRTKLPNDCITYLVISRFPKDLNIFSNIYSIDMRNMTINMKIFDISQLENLGKLKLRCIHNNYNDDNDKNIWELVLPKSITSLKMLGGDICNINVPINLQKLVTRNNKCLTILEGSKLTYLDLDNGKIRGEPPKKLNFLRCRDNVLNFFEKTQIDMLQIRYFDAKKGLNVGKMLTKRLIFDKNFQFCNRNSVIFPKDVEYIDDQQGDSANFPSEMDKLKKMRTKINKITNKHVFLRDYYRNLTKLAIHFWNIISIDLVTNENLIDLSISGYFNGRIIFNENGSLRKLFLELDRIDDSKNIKTKFVQPIDTLPKTIRKLRYISEDNIKLDLESTILADIHLKSSNVNCRLPDTCKKLYIETEKMHINIPKNLTELEIRHRKLKALPRLPDSLIVIRLPFSISVNLLNIPKNLLFLQINSKNKYIKEMKKLDICVDEYRS